MRLIIEPNYEKLSKWAANYVIERINAAKNQDKPFVLGLPTGSSPEGMYAELVCQRTTHRAIIPSWLRISLTTSTVQRRTFIS